MVEGKENTLHSGVLETWRVSFFCKCTPGQEGGEGEERGAGGRERGEGEMEGKGGEGGRSDAVLSLHHIRDD